MWEKNVIRYFFFYLKTQKSVDRHRKNCTEILTRKGDDDDDDEGKTCRPLIWSVLIVCRPLSALSHKNNQKE